MSPALAVYLKECRESLRDRRVLLNTLVLGPLLGPVLFVILLRLTIARIRASNSSTSHGTMMKSSAPWSRAFVFCSTVAISASIITGTLKSAAP